MPCRVALLRAILVAWLAALPAAAQSDEDRYTACAGSLTALWLEPPRTDFLELSGQQGRLVFGDWVQACLFPDRVEISGPYPMDLTCEDLRDPIDEGAGYGFTDSAGVPAELWFYVDPVGTEPVLEIGVKIEGAAGYWIDTRWPICRDAA